MALPISRVVNVNLTRRDNFPSREGFGTMLILTTESVAGVVDIDNRTKLYGSINEVATDWDAATEPYKAAEAAFARNPRPLGLRIGYTDAAESGSDGDFVTDIGLLYDADSEWYIMTTTAELRTAGWETHIAALSDWMETRNKILLVDSHDSDMTDSGNTSNLAALKKGTVERTGVFYHPVVGTNLAASIGAYMTTRNLDDARSYYTLKFTPAPTIPAASLNSDQVTAVTGFTPGLGQSVTAGHCANTYVDIGGQNFLVEGSTLTPNVFLNTIHISDWIVARTEEALLATFLNNDVVPYDDNGLDLLAGAVRQVMHQAQVNGIVASDVDPENPGSYLAGYTVTIPSAASVSPAQRATRVAPAIQVTFRYAGAIHYSTVNYDLTF